MLNNIYHLRKLLFLPYYYAHHLMVERIHVAANIVLAVSDTANEKKCPDRALWKLTRYANICPERASKNNGVFPYGCRIGWIPARISLEKTLHNCIVIHDNDWYATIYSTVPCFWVLIYKEYSLYCFALLLVFAFSC